MLEVFSFRKPSNVFSIYLILSLVKAGWQAIKKACSIKRSEIGNSPTTIPVPLKAGWRVIFPAKNNLHLILLFSKCLTNSFLEKLAFLEITTG